MLHTTGKENLSLFILLVLFIIDIDTLQAKGILKFHLLGPSYIFFVRHQRDTWTVWNSWSFNIEWLVCVNGLQFITGGFRVFVNISIVFLFFQDTKFSEV